MGAVVETTAREQAAQHGVTDRRGGIAQRRVLPAMTADIDEGGEVGAQFVQPALAKRFGRRARGEFVGGPFERAQPVREEEKLPGHGHGDAECFQRRTCTAAGVAPAVHAGRLVGDSFRADEYIEGIGETLAERRHAQHRVDIRQVRFQPVISITANTNRQLQQILNVRGKRIRARVWSL